MSHQAAHCLSFPPFFATESKLADAEEELAAIPRRQRQTLAEAQEEVSEAHWLRVCLVQTPP